MYKLLSRSMFALMVVILLPLSVVNAAQVDIQNELQEYINLFKGDNYASQRKAISPLSWSGISDERLYDVVADKLTEMAEIDNKISSEKASWFAKALALSGNEKYRPLLQELIDGSANKKIRKYAALALVRLEQYQAWNPKISKGLAQAPIGQLEESRVLNMLNDQDPEIIQLGAKRVYYGHSDNENLVGVASERLLAEYQKVGKDKERIDAVAWLIKALAQSGDSTHKATLMKVEESANNKKVSKYAKKYVDYL